MAPIQQYIDQVVRTLERLLAGEPAEDIGEIYMSDLAHVERWMGLKKPLVEYAPRSRRRFISAARKGYKPSEAYKQEQTARQTSSVNKWGLTAKQYGVIHKLMNKIVDSGVDIEYYFDPPVIKEFATVYGYDYLVTVFTQQIDSIEHYKRGDRTPGRTRWDDRGSIEERYNNDFAVSVYMIRGTDPYYYYHATR